MKPIHLLACAAALAAVAGCDSKPSGTATNEPLSVQPVPPPAGGDWATVVQATPEGGYAMGNPNAKVTLVEFGSMTCPHCAEFDETGVQPLIDKYVKAGHVRYEFRNYVRDPFDLAASLVARCNTESSFFPLTRALYKDQASWLNRIQAAPPQQLEAIQSLPSERVPAEAAKLAGFQQWAAMRGVGSAKSSACLADTNEVNRLVQMTSQAMAQFPNFRGTPSFVLNGKLLENTATWDALEPQLRDAVGG
jgi:protein-disulfide isomerase